MEEKQRQIQSLPIPKLIIQYAIPTILSNLVVLIYNLADTFFVGHTNNPVEIAALTLSFPLFMSLNIIGNLFGIGANSLISRSLGKKDVETAKRVSTFAFYCALAGALIWSLVLVFCNDWLLPLIGATTPGVFAATSGYVRWVLIIGGMPTVGNLILAHLIRAEGKTRLASLGVALGGILNIILDPIFVQGFQLGAKGAGIATCISNAVAMGYLLYRALRDRDMVICLDLRCMRVKGSMVKEVLSVGAPAALIILLGSLCNVVLTHHMAEYGEVYVAAFGVVQKVGSIFMQVTIGLTQGIMPLLGYCYGAGDFQRVKDINKWAFGIIACFVLVSVLLVELFPGTIIGIFTRELQVIAAGTEFVRRWILCTLGMCFTSLFSSIFQAMGKWKESLTLSVVRQACLIIPLLILLNRLMGAYGLVWSQPIADTLALLIGTGLYRSIVSRETHG